MTLISYAQNFEDIVLWRALKHVSNGFYVDVGANDPEIDSVTKLFYAQGWHGINIEPLPRYHGRLIAERTRDINLKVAAGPREGEAIIYDVPDAVGLASLDEDVARRHQQQGYDVTRLTVPLRTLSSICAEYVSSDIHFLKIDVEGYEAAVLEGMDFKKWRPWVLVIEATLPLSRTTNHEKWEPLLTSHGYRCVFLDGLNRYYVADEHADLGAELAKPANVFDDFLPIAQQKAMQAESRALVAAQEAEARARQAELNAQQAEARAQQSEARAQQSEARAQQSEARAQQSEARAQQSEARAQRAEVKTRKAEVSAQQAGLKAQQAQARAHQAEASAHQAHASVGSILATRSWRVTAPLRYTFDHTESSLRTIKQVATSPEHRLNLLMKGQDRIAKCAPGLNAVALSVLDHFPGTKERLDTAILERLDRSPPTVTAEDLGTRARTIYHALGNLTGRTRRG